MARNANVAGSACCPKSWKVGSTVGCAGTGPLPSGMRSGFLLVALVFCLIFGGMTAAVAAQSGFDIFTVVSFGIVIMILIAILGALRNPPGS